MVYIYKYLFIFIFFCFIGWILEVMYRSYKHKYFVNPGFLVGCALPIYGTGGLALYLMCSLNLSFISNEVIRIIVLMIICTIMMTVIEFVAGYVSLKYYHNRLWDYSDQPGNIMGIICPLFSLAWGLCALIFYFGFMPWLPKLSEFVASHSYMILMLGIAYGIFFVDLGYSLKVMDRVRAYAKHAKETINFEEFKKNVKEKLEKSKIKIKSLSFLKLRNHITNMIDSELEKEEKKDSLDNKNN